MKNHLICWIYCPFKKNEGYDLAATCEGTARGAGRRISAGRASAEVLIGVGRIGFFPFCGSTGFLRCADHKHLHEQAIKLKPGDEEGQSSCAEPRSDVLEGLAWIYTKTISYKDYPTGFKVKSRHVAGFRDLMLSYRVLGQHHKGRRTALDNYF